MRGRSRLGLRLAAGVALSSLRFYWGGALVIVGLGAAGVAALTPVRSLASPSDASQPLIALAPIPAADAALPTTESLVEPDALQTKAVSDLYLLLLILAWAAIVIAGISMLTRFSALAAGRGAEVGVRRAAGASRRDLLLCFLAEGGVLFVAVLALGVPIAALLLSRWTGQWPGPVAAASLMPWGALVLVAWVIGFGVLAPLRYSTDRYLATLADGQVSLGVPAFQLAMSLAILMGGSVLLQRAPAAPAGQGAGSSAQVFEIGPGSEPPESRARTLGAMIRALEQAPGVSGVSAASRGTLVGLGSVDDATTDCGMCYRGGIVIRYQLVTARHHEVSAGTFGLQGIKVLSGRSFSSGDGWDAPRVAVVSRHLAMTAFQQGAAVGRDLFLGHDWPKRPYRVIGVVDDAVPAALGGALEPLDTIYLHVLQHPPRTIELTVQGSGDAAGQPPGLLGSAGEILAGAALPVRWFGARFSMVGLVVLLAALAGTFGTMRMWVGSCTADIAARRAVGATRTRIVAWVLWHTVGTGVKGVLVGLFLYFSVFRVSLTNLIGATPPWDPTLFGALAALLLGAAVLGAALPTAGLLRRPIATLFP